MNRRPALVGALLAVALGCAACTSTASPNPTNPVTSPPPVSQSPSGSGATTTSASPTTTSASATAPTTGTGSAPPAAVTVGADWATHVNFATVPHPDMHCENAGLGNRVEVGRVVTGDVTGDRSPDAVVSLDCAHSASEWPDWVFVYSDSTGTPKAIATLISDTDSTYAPTIATSGRTVTVGLVTWSKYAAGCCPDLHYTQTFTWTGAGFERGARRDVLLACADTAFTVSATAPDSATGHSGIVLEFGNRLPQACTIRGYPGLDAVNSADHVLAHATRTLNGFTGGAHSIPTLTVSPGRTVSARVEWLNFNPATSGSCPTSASIEVTPANTSDTVDLPVKVTVCGLQVHPTVAGSTGNG